MPTACSCKPEGLIRQTQTLLITLLAVESETSKGSDAHACLGEIGCSILSQLLTTAVPGW